MRKKKPPSGWISDRPPISFYQVRNAYIFYRGEYRAVEPMPTPLFKQALTEVHPDAVVSPYLNQACLGLVERWYLLMCYPLKLFYLKKGVFCDR
jgi:hypothetical protein